MLSLEKKRERSNRVCVSDTQKKEAWLEIEIVSGKHTVDGTTEAHEGMWKGLEKRGGPDSGSEEMCVIH